MEGRQTKEDWQNCKGKIKTSDKQKTDGEGSRKGTAMRWVKEEQTKMTERLKDEENGEITKATEKKRRQGTDQNCNLHSPTGPPGVRVNSG